MVSVIGRLFIIFIMCISELSCASSVSISIVDMQDKVIHEVSAGEVCRLVITVNDVNMELHSVKGLETFKLGGKVTKHNENRVAELVYPVRQDQPGDYVIGPAIVMSSGQVVQSNIVPLRVNIPVSTKDNTVENAPVFARLSVDKDTIVVGEQLNCCVRFYYLDQEIDSCLLNKCSALEYKNEKPLIRGTEKINGKHYSFIEWQWSMYPTVADTLIIPAHGIDYYVMKTYSHRRPAFNFMMHQLEPKKLYSNAASVTVQALPPTTVPVDWIGTISTLHCDIKPTVVKQGEGSILSLTFEGAGNFDKLGVPKLQLPDGLKYYDSKHAYTPLNESQGRKSFEYVVQGLKDGAFEIPRQLFTYYDVEQKKYRTLETIPLVVTVLPNASRSLEQDKPQQDETRLSIIYHEVLPYVEHKPIALWLFIILLFLPLGLVAVPLVYRFVHEHTAYENPTLRYAQAFNRAYKMLKKDEKNNRVINIHHIFITLFMDRWRIAEGEINQECIENKLRKSGFSLQEYEQWRSFFEQLTAITFSSAHYDASTIKNLFSQAYQWLKRLEKSI